MINNQQQNGVVSIEDLNTAAQQTLIHIDLDKTFYSISPPELNIIEAGSSSIWKDITLSGLGIGIPCAVNALLENQKATTFNAEIFWNSLIGGICIIIAIIFLIIWIKSKDSCADLIKDIKQRPKYKIQ